MWLVIGYGSTLHSDDGFGPVVAEQLRTLLATDADASASADAAPVYAQEGIPPVPYSDLPSVSDTTGAGETPALPVVRATRDRSCPRLCPATIGAAIGQIGGNATIGAAIGQIGGNATIGAAIDQIGGNATIGAAMDRSAAMRPPSQAQRSRWSPPSSSRPSWPSRSAGRMGLSLSMPASTRCPAR